MTEQVNKNHVDMDKWLTDNNITEVECLVPDLTGVARGKILPREKFSTDRAMRLPEAVFGMTVTGESPDCLLYTSRPAPVLRVLESTNKS